MTFNDNNFIGCATKNKFYYCQVSILDPVNSNRWKVFHTAVFCERHVNNIQYIFYMLLRPLLGRRIMQNT